MRHYLGILLIIDSSPHINDKSIKWEMDTNVILMNKSIWSKYMHNEKDDILSLYMQLDPTLKDDEYILDLDNSILKVQGYHSITPGSMILTLKSMLYLKNHFTFDYIIRATTSTFWVLPKLKNILLNLPRNNIYKGSLYFGPFVSGSGMIFSKDVVDILLQFKNDLLDVSNNMPDDVLLAKFMRCINMPFTDMRICNFDEKILTSEEIDNIIKDNDIDEICCFRVKTGCYVAKIRYEDRLKNDTIILNKLYNYYYNT